MCSCTCKTFQKAQSIFINVSFDFECETIWRSLMLTGGSAGGFGTCVCTCVCLQCFYSPTTTTMAIRHTYLNSMQEGRPKYTCLTCSWQRVGTASSCHHLGPPLQSPPIPASKPLPAASPQFASVPPFFASALARPRPVLWCGGAGTPVPY